MGAPASGMEKEGHRPHTERDPEREKPASPERAMDLVEHDSREPLVVDPQRLRRNVGEDVFPGNSPFGQGEPTRGHATPEVLVGFMEGEGEKDCVQDQARAESEGPMAAGVHLGR